MSGGRMKCGKNANSIDTAGDLSLGSKMVFTPRALCNNPFVRYRVRVRENTKIINFQSRLW